MSLFCTTRSMRVAPAAVRQLYGHTSKPRVSVTNSHIGDSESTRNTAYIQKVSDVSINHAASTSETSPSQALQHSASVAHTTYVAWTIFLVLVALASSIFAKVVLTHDASCKPCDCDTNSTNKAEKSADADQEEVGENARVSESWHQVGGGAEVSEDSPPPEKVALTPKEVFAKVFGVHDELQHADSTASDVDAHPSPFAVMQDSDTDSDEDLPKPAMHMCASMSLPNMKGKMWAWDPVFSDESDDDYDGREEPETVKKDRRGKSPANLRLTV
jgi:hypothetical protein